MCSPDEKNVIEEVGAPLLDNIIEIVMSCDKQLNTPYYYASFPDDNASSETLTHAKFTYLSADELILECSISGQESHTEYNFHELC